LAKIMKDNRWFSRLPRRRRALTEVFPPTRTQLKTMPSGLLTRTASTIAAYTLNLIMTKMT
jgi:hypothetical protein